MLAGALHPSADGEERRMKSPAQELRVVHITTAPETLRFLSGQIRFLKSCGCRVSVISSPGPLLDEFARTEGVEAFSATMPRRITPWRDLATVFRLWRILRIIRPRLVHAHTPKGGLLGMIAARLAGVPARIYHIRGLPYMTASGFRRWLLMRTEKISCGLAHRVLAVSHSMREEACDAGLCASSKIATPLRGSGNGVDAEGRFNPSRLPDSAGAATRAAHDIPHDALVVGFVGRIVRDKGIIELVHAWGRVQRQFPRAHLLVVGRFEPQDAVPGDVEHALRTGERIHLAATDWNTPPLYAAMDLVVLPTYREGFPNVPLESAAMGKPVVATRIPGCIDAVEDGVTGTLVPPRDADALAEAIASYLKYDSLRARHGAAGRQRVLRDFRPEPIWREVWREYVELLERKKATRHSFYLRYGKAWLDRIAALAGLLVLSPVFAFVAALVRWRLGAPILFTQQRIGRGAKPFRMVKFRTMTDAKDKQGRLLPDEERLTRFGRFLRRTSLDEMPELWNVLRGEMSVVGPRPLLPEYLEHYTPEEARRHDVAPGLTGWAQVNGRNAVPWDARLRLDAWYVDHVSLWLDVKIMAMTVAKVFSQKGVSAEGHATMPRFDDERRRANSARAA
jgi:lipopolysaccharide/colanic/teichoic acid biosynthesis glycosyltransferase/glycosyltransferase involved in cell wall biosynthesis